MPEDKASKGGRKYQRDSGCRRVNHQPTGPVKKFQFTPYVRVGKVNKDFSFYNRKKYCNKRKSQTKAM